MKKPTRMIPLILILQVLFVACGTGPRETGILQGIVTIGPLVPVVGPGVEEPTPGPEVFRDRKVVVFDSGGKRQLHVVDIQHDTSYRVELEIGTYVVDINHLGIDHAKGLPATVEIQASQVTVLDIDIDTGIR